MAKDKTESKEQTNEKVPQRLKKVVIQKKKKIKKIF